MANYTMEIRQMIDNPLIGLFTFDYDFYSDIHTDKEAFEKLFIQWYYFREIGFETPERFKLKLQAKLNMIMPYYRQLAMTEWDKVRTVEQMMSSKNLIETTEHKQSIEGSNESESNATSSNNQSDSMNQSSTTSGTSDVTTSGTNSATTTTTEKQSNLSDGVSQASLSDGYLTSSGESTNTSNGETSDTTNTTISSNGTSNSSTSSQGTSEQNGKTSGNNKQELTESTTFTSSGDIGIQTPAYAITEWRKVILNLNEMIIKDCEDLFMKLY